MISTSFTFKKIATPLLLALFMMVALFGFAVMSHGSDGRMEGGCPFSNMGALLCPQDTLSEAIHHISAYHSFLNAPVNLGIIALIIALLVVAYVAPTFSFHQLLYRPPVLVLYKSPPFTSEDRKIKRWLSLFEHSPSR